MIDPNLSDSEKLCLRILAKLFAEGKSGLGADRVKTLRAEGLELASDRDYGTMLEMMAKFGATEREESPLSNSVGAFAGYRSLRISASVVGLVRELDALEKKEQEPSDIVEKIKANARRNGIVAWALIGFAVFVGAVTGVNQIVQLMQNLGWMAKP